MAGKVWSSTINDIAGCIGSETAVVVSAFSRPLTERTLRKAAVVIFTFKLINDVRSCFN